MLNEHMHFLLMRYNMNGTFAGTIPLDTSFSYCRVPAPKTRKGGGTTDQTKYQNFGASLKTRKKCDLADLTTRLNEQYTYEVRCMNTLKNGNSDWPAFSFFFQFLLTLSHTDSILIYPAISLRCAKIELIAHSRTYGQPH